MSAGEILAVRQIEKRYGGVRALKGVSFGIRAGEVHALVGENGAGKSTLTKILGGSVKADAGEFILDGQSSHYGGLDAAKAFGIETVQQELELALPLSAAENIFLGILPSRRGFVRRRECVARAGEILRSLGASFDPAALVRDLTVPDRQVVEIARALARKSRILLLDEPTAALSQIETARLLDRVRSLCGQGVGIVYISHRLDEVIDIADRVSVLRDGQNVGEFRRGELCRATLAEAILGKELEAVSYEKKRRAGAPAVVVQRLNVGSAVADLSFEAEQCAVVGFFGLLGAGQSTIAAALFGDARNAGAERSRILVHDGLPRSPSDAVSWGLGYVPADRRHDGLALSLSIRENLMLASTRSVTRLGFVQRSRSRRRALEFSRRYDIRMRDVEQPARELSGGNQQKIVLARWASVGSSILLLDEPTRGVDVGAKAEIYRELREFARRGGTALVFSSDAEEIATVCDRAYVLQRGRLAAELEGADMTTDQLLAAALQ